MNKVSTSPLVVYYLNQSDRSQPLPSLLHKYEVKFITNPKEPKAWREQGRRNLLEQYDRYLATRMQKKKGADDYYS